MVVKQKKKKEKKIPITDAVGISKALKKARKRKKFSQKLLALESNCSSAVISRIERGVAIDCDRQSLERLSDVLEINLLQFSNNKDYQIKKRKEWDYQPGQKVRLADGSICTVVSVLKRTIVVKDKFDDMRLLGKGEFHLVKKSEYDRGYQWS